MHVENLLFDFDPRAPFNQDIDLLTAAGVPVADGQAPAWAKAEIAHADVFASEDPTQNPQFKFVFGETESRLRPVRSVGDCQHLRLHHGLIMSVCRSLRDERNRPRPRQRKA